MQLHIEPKEIVDAYSTPIVQQTSFWSKVKERSGITSRAFEFAVRNSDLYNNVGGYSYTQADFILFFQQLNREDYVAYVPYGPEIEPSQENQGQFLDMFGISPSPNPAHPMYGLYKFKQGFGGEIYHQLGCWDYPLEEDKYNYFAAREMNMQGYYQQ